MRFNPPTKVTFYISVFLALLGLVGFFMPTVPVVGAFAFWFLFVGYAYLVLGLFVKGM